MARHRQKPRQRAVNTRRKKFRTSENKFVPPRTPEEFFAMPKKYQQLWGDIGQVTTEVRLGASLAQAARKFDVDPRTVRRLAAPALRKLRNRRWVAKKYDRLLRVLTLPSPQGLIEVGVRD